MLVSRTGLMCEIRLINIACPVRELLHIALPTIDVPPIAHWAIQQLNIVP
jgi:hypothetical protein